MVVLGFDGATSTVAVAVAAGDRVLFEHSEQAQSGDRPRHGTDLLEAIERGAAQAGGWDAVDRIAVGVGPGSFTGLRIAIATARALAQGTGTELVGVGTLEALASGIRDRAGADGAVTMPVVDARRGEVYVSADGPDGRRLIEPAAVEPAELVANVRGLDLGAMRIVAAGDGALRFRSVLEAAGVEVAGDAEPANQIAARHVCALGAARKASSPWSVEPTYLREPDAQIWLKRNSS